MNGTVTVVNQPLVTTFNTTATATNSTLSSAAGGQTSTITNKFRNYSYFAHCYCSFWFEYEYFRVPP
jgi:hypothetical protein